MYVLVIVAYLAAGLPEIIILNRKKQKKELWIYCVIFIFAFIVAILLVANVNLPRPMALIEKIFPVTGNQ